MGHASHKARPYPLAGEELRVLCRNVSGGTLAKNAVVRLVTGTNTTGAVLDDVPILDWFGDQIVAIGGANYPTAGDDGPVASQDRVCPHAIGVLEAATADDGFGWVVLRGLVPDLTLTVVNAEVYAQGGLVFLDSSAAFALLVESVSANVLAIGDIIVGRLAEGFTASGTSNVSKVLWNGMDREPRAV